MLIHPSHLQLDNLDTITGEIKKLFGLGYDAVISSDVCGINSNAYQIDQDKPEFNEYNLTHGISSAIFMSSFGSKGVNQGLTVKELKLQLLAPESFNHNSINSSLDELQNKAYYLYYSQTGASEQRFWYHTKPNLNILINNAHSDIKTDRIESQIINLLEDRGGRVTKFKTIVNPKGDIPELKSPSLIVLHPTLYHNGNKKLEEAIKQIALKKGNSDRIYRNTILFLSPSKDGRTALYNVIREYLACIKIREDYPTLETDQIKELRNRIEDAQKKMQHELVTAYNNVHKYSASKGMETIELKQFADSLERQISTTLFDVLKDEEMLLEAVGHNTLKRNNLLPEKGKSIQTNQVLEAFLRYDDKPMIVDKSAVQNSLTKYCYNKQFAIASKSSNDWTHMYFGETVPMFDVTDETYWLVSTDDYNEWLQSQKQEDEKYQTPVESHTEKPGGESTFQVGEKPKAEAVPEEKVFSKIVVSGKTNPVAFNQLFASFIMPLKENNIEIEFKITARSNKNSPIKENSQVYKIVKESASQMGFELEEE